MLQTAALLLAALAVGASSNAVLAQAPEGPLVLVNAGREFVDRKAGGEFVARPVFDREIDALHYGVRDADTGDWLSAVFRVRAEGRERSDGWEYAWEYPFEDAQPGLDPDRAYLLVMLAGEAGGAQPRTFHAVIPVHQPGGLWDRVLGALDPARWARAAARWVVEGVHGTLCGVIERAAGVDAEACREDGP